MVHQKSTGHYVCKASDWWKTSHDTIVTPRPQTNTYHKGDVGFPPLYFYLLALPPSVQVVITQENFFVSQFIIRNEERIFTRCKRGVQNIKVIINTEKLRRYNLI